MVEMTVEKLIFMVEESYFSNVDNKNLDATLACFAPDAELTIQTAHTTHKGQNEIRRMFHDFMTGTPSIYHGDFTHVVDIKNQCIASQFLARNENSDGSIVAMRNCNFFIIENGRFKKVNVYMSGENPLV